MRLTIGGAKGLSLKKFDSIHQRLEEWGARKTGKGMHYGWELVEINFFHENGIVASLKGHIPINNQMVEDLEQIFLDHQIGFGTAPEDVAVLLYPDW
jgi:hypothetical protein